MANYNVTITNGAGSERIQRGVYTVSATAADGYDLSTLTPTTYTVTDGENTGNFTLAANGTLTLNVNETGEAGGTPITSGTIQMTNEDGTVDYGSAVTIGADGNAVFDNVPYGTTAEPYALYFRQLTTADGYNVYDGVITVQMTGQAQTEYVQNTATATQTFSLTDATYGLPIDGSLEFAENA